MSHNLVCVCVVCIGESEDESSPYWCWTHKAEEAEEAEYTSDEDDCSEIASDEDAPADEAEIEVLRWLNCRGEICRCSGTHEVVGATHARQITPRL